MMTTVLIILFSILFSAFFSGVEIAYVSSNKLKMELAIKQKGLTTRLLKKFYRNPSQYITTMLIGNNISLVVFGVYAAELIMTQLFPSYVSGDEPYWVMLIQVLISTIVILLTAEFLPKILFSINPNRMLSVLSLPIGIFYFLFYPVAKFSIFLSKIIIFLFFKDNKGNQKNEFTFGKVDIDAFIQDEMPPNTDEPSVIEQEIKIFRNALDFSDIKVKECLIPRTEVVAVEQKDDVTELKELFIQTGYTRIVVFKENIDNIVGYVHSSVLFRNPKSIKNIVTTIPIVPESMSAQKVLRRLNEENKGIAVVVDEFGGTEGIVTQEDIMEEIFGEIEDEHDKNSLVDRKINKLEYVFSGRHEIDFINDKYSLGLPDEDGYETLAGLILHINQDIPKLNEVVLIGERFKFKILEVSNTRIEKVYLTVLES